MDAQFRRLTNQSDRWAYLAIASVAAVFAVLADGQPTGTIVWDEVLKAGTAFVVVLAGSKGPRWAVMVLAALAAAFGGLTLSGLLGWVALGLAVATSAFRRRNRLAGAVVCAIAVQALLRLPSIGFFGLQTIVAGFGFSAVAISGYRYATSRVRRSVRRALAAVAAIGAVLVVAGGTSILGARADVDRGIAASDRGLEAVRDGDAASAVSELQNAEQALQRAHSRLSQPWVRTLRLVPIAAQHQRSVEAATLVGADLASSAVAMADEADISDITLDVGSVDLAALGSVADPLRVTSTNLSDARERIELADSPWLLPIIRSRFTEISDEIYELLPEVELASVAAEVLPDMLGVNGEQTYLVFFGTPAESRELGGFVGSWALISFENGQLRLGESGRKPDMRRVARNAEVAPGTVSDWFLEMARPTEFPENLTSSPDMRQVAEVSRQVLGGLSDTPLAGLIYIDARALISLLELSGPLSIEFHQGPLTAVNAPDFFFDDQYRVDPELRTEVFDALADAADQALERLSQSASLPGPAELGRILGPAARAGHLQVVTFNERHNEFLSDVKLLREFAPSTQDFVAVVQTNGLANKLDLYLERELDYQATVDAEGVIRANATISLSSNVPADAPAFTLGSGDTVGVNKVLLSLYSPLTLDSVTIDGVPADVRIASEFGIGRYLVEVNVPPNEASIVVDYSLNGQVSRDEPYSLEVWHQPLINDDMVSIAIEGLQRDLEWSGPLNENLVLFESPE